jgi:uncharacterized OB-fold protein
MNPDLVAGDDHELPVPAMVSGRAVPMVTSETAPFWEGLARGEIVLQRCGSCRRWNALPAAGCPWCGSPDVTYEVVDGRGELYSFSACYTEFGPGMQTPYVVGIVAPDCEPQIRIVTNVVGCRVRDVRIGARMCPVVVPSDSGHLLFYRPETT